MRVPRPKPILLLILDGWGQRAETTNNAIALAQTPNWTSLLAECPHTLVETHGRHVGLPDGQMGNSEVGHLNIGAGRVVMQELPRISQAIEDGTLAERPAFKELIAGLNPGVKLVPAHTMALGLAQEHGCTYEQIG